MTRGGCECVYMCTDVLSNKWSQTHLHHLFVNKDVFVNKVEENMFCKRLVFCDFRFFPKNPRFFSALKSRREGKQECMWTHFLFIWVFAIFGRHFTSKHDHHSDAMSMFWVISLNGRMRQRRKHVRSIAACVEFIFRCVKRRFEQILSWICTKHAIHFRSQ